MQSDGLIRAKSLHEIIRLHNLYITTVAEVYDYVQYIRDFNNPFPSGCLAQFEVMATIRNILQKEHMHNK